MFAVRRRSRRSDRQGAALVEAAVVLPIFFLAILGIVEFGRAMMVGQLVTNAAREGARRAILYGSEQSEVTTHIEEFLQNAGGIDPADVTLNMSYAAGPDRTGGAPSSLADTESGDRVTVEVSVPWDKAGWGTLRWLSGKSFRSAATMRHE